MEINLAKLDGLREVTAGCDPRLITAAELRVAIALASTPPHLVPVAGWLFDGAASRPAGVDALDRLSRSAPR